jgi:hypothetical protein
MSYVATTRCTTCTSGATVAVAPAWANRARCGACIAAGVPYVGDLIEVVRPPVLVPQQAPEPEIEPEQPHPAPEHTSRDPWPAGLELPAGAKRIKREAEHAGWAVGQTYSRGWSVHGVTGKPSAYGSRIALRMLHPETGNRCIVIYYTKDSGTTALESTFILGPGLPPYTGCNATEIKEFIILQGRVLPSWVDAVRFRNWLAANKDKVWANYCNGATLTIMAKVFEQPREVIMKIVQDCRAAGKAKPGKGSSTKESGG